MNKLSVILIFYEGQVGTMIEELSGRLGEKIYIKKFSRIEVGA